MSQFDKNEVSDNVTQPLANKDSGKIDGSQLLKDAGDLFKRIAEAKNNSTSLHDVHVHDDANENNRVKNSQSGKDHNTAGESPATRVPDKNVDSGKAPETHQKTSDKPPTSPPQVDSGNSGDSATTRNMSDTIIANPKPGTVTLEPHNGGMAHVLHIDQLPVYPPYPGPATVTIKP